MRHELLKLPADKNESAHAYSYYNIQHRRDKEINLSQGRNEYKIYSSVWYFLVKYINLVTSQTISCKK